MIHNKTTNKVISNKETIANSLFSQGLGLMFSKKRNLVMVFQNERKISLHNFFVFFPLEIILVDSNNTVIEIKPKFKPFTFFNPKHNAKYLIELGLPKSKNKCKVGDKIKF